MDICDVTAQERTVIWQVQAYGAPQLDDDVGEFKLWCVNFYLMKDNVGQWKWKINATHNIVTEMLHFQKHQLNEIPWN